MFLGRRHVDLVVVAHGIRDGAVEACHPALDVGCLAADLVQVGVDNDGGACDGVLEKGNKEREGGRRGGGEKKGKRKDRRARGKGKR